MQSQFIWSLVMFWIDVDSYKNVNKICLQKTATLVNSVGSALCSLMQHVSKIDSAHTLCGKYSCYWDMLKCFWSQKHCAERLQHCGAKWNRGATPLVSEALCKPTSFWFSFRFSSVSIFLSCCQVESQRVLWATVYRTLLIISHHSCCYSYLSCCGRLFTADTALMSVW